MAYSSLNYAEWAVDTYELRIRPVIKSLSNHIYESINTNIWLDTCNSGSSVATRHRFFPGAFFLLWIDALGQHSDQEGSLYVAAAIELLHNSTLVHDDLVDGHSIRKGQPTLLSLHGSSVALLAGDGLLAAALSILSKVPSSKLPGCLSRLGDAMEKVVAGQILDEPQYWQEISKFNQYNYWLRVCEGKLSLGNIAGPLAAFWIGKPSLEKEIKFLMDDFSVISQIINDFGDWLGFAGYHTIAPSLRIIGEEALIKPTLPSIWSQHQDTSQINANEANLLIAKGQDEISKRKSLALKRLKDLGISSKEITGKLPYDFFSSPGLPERLTNRQA